MEPEIDRQRLRELCRVHHIRRLSLFGSILRDPGPDSDVDLLVEFEPEHVPGFLRLSSIADDFAELFGDRPIDLVTESFLNPRIRDRVLAEARLEYAQG